MRTRSRPSLPFSPLSMSVSDSAMIRASFSRVATGMCKRVATGSRAARSKRSALGASRPAPVITTSAGRASLSPGSGTTTQSSGRGRLGGAADPQW